MGLFSQDKVKIDVRDLTQGGGERIVPGTRYVSFRLLSTRLKKSRVAWTKLYLSTYSRLQLYYPNDEGVAKFEKVVSPNFFKDIDPGNLDRVKSINHALFGPVPYQGGLQFDCGIFSVKTRDLLAPYLSLLEEASKKASLPFVSAAMPFVGLVKSGAEELFGQGADTTLEAGISRGFADENLRTGIYAVVRNDTDQELPELSYDEESFVLLRPDGSELTNTAYFVYEVKASAQRNDWRSIPALSQAWKAFSKGLQDGNIDGAYNDFRKVCYTCWDLLEADRDKLSEKAKKQADIFRSFKERGHNNDLLGRKESTAEVIPNLEAIELSSADEAKDNFSVAFRRSMPFILRWEGGYVNHPNDPGGATNKGVTQRVYDKWRESKGLAQQTVKNITDAEVNEIYYSNYWLRVKCDTLGERGDLQLVLFDTAVNMGVRRATLILQQALQVKVDGIFGPQTRHAALTYPLPDLLEKYCEIREEFYRFLAKRKPKLKVFLRGWLNRLNSLRSEVGVRVIESTIASDHSHDALTPRLEHIEGLDAKDDSEFFQTDTLS